MEEDLVYFYLSGNMLSVGQTLSISGTPSTNNDIYIVNNGDTFYGIVDFQYVPLTQEGTTYKYNGTVYNGTIFVERTGNRRFYSEFKAVNDMALTLLSQNAQMPGKIQLAVIDLDKTSIIDYLCYNMVDWKREWVKPTL